MLVFDISDMPSFQALKVWRTTLQNVSYCGCGNVGVVCNK